MSIMRRFLPWLLPLCAMLLLVTGARASGVTGGGRRSAPAAAGHQRGYHMERMPGVSPLRPVPITRGVDLVWPPVIIEPPGYAAPYVPAPAEYAGETAPAESGERGVDVKLDDCMDNAGMAGYNFSERKVVSCEDSTVDIYLSFNEDGNYFFLVPEDAEIKDVGPRNEVRTVRLIKPGNWSPDHGAPLTAGHVYVVWAYSGDLYIVKVEALWEKHVMFSWRWHSHLSRVDADRFLKEHAGGPPASPYFNR